MEGISPTSLHTAQQGTLYIKRLIGIQGSAITLALLFTLIFYAQIQAWQLLAAVPVFHLALLCVWKAWRALRRQALSQVGNWLIASVAICYGGTQMLFAGVTVEILFSLILLVPLIGNLVMPQKWQRWGILLILMSACIGSIDWFAPSFRLDIAPTMMGGFTLILSLALGLGMVWQTIRMSGQIDLLGQALDELQSTDKTLRRKLDELTVLHAVAGAGVAADNEDDLIARATRLIGDALYPDNFGVILLDAKTGVLRPHRSYHHYGAVTLNELPPGAGITGAVFASGKPRYVPDISQDPTYIPTTLLSGSELCVPLTIGGKIIGVVNAESQQCHAFNEYDEHLLTTLAGQLATAIDRLRGLEKARRRAQEFAAIYDVGRKITSILRMEELLPAITRLVVELLSLYNCEIALVEEDRLVFKAGYGGYTGSAFQPGDTQALGVGLTGQAAASGQTVLAPDVHEHHHFVPAPLLPEVQAELAVPLTYKGQITGVIDVKSAQVNGLDADNAALLEILAIQVAIAIENTRLFQAERDRSTELETLRQAELQLTKNLALEPALHAILESALKLTAADDVHIFLYDGETLDFGAALWRDAAEHHPFTELRENGVTYTAVRTKKLIVVDRISGHPLFKDTAWSGAIAGLPLCIDDNVVGVLNVAYAAPHQFDENELRVLGFLGDQAAIVIHNVRLFEATERQLNELAILHGVATTAAQVTHEDALIECATDLIGQTLYPDSFGILLIENGQLHFHPSYRWHGARREPDCIPIGRGVTGQVAQSGRPRNIADVSREANYIVLDPAIRSELCVPLKTGEDVIGVVNAESTRPHAFTDDDERLLMTFAHQLTAGIEKARLFNEIAETLEREQRLNAFTRTISQGLNLVEILHNAVQQAAELVGADAASLRLLSDDGATLSVPYTYNMPERIARQLPKGQGVSWHIVETRQPILLTEYSRHPQAWAEMSATGVCALVGAPVTVGENLIGTLGLFSLTPEKCFTDRDRALTESIGRHLGIAIQNARLYTQVQERAAELTAALERLQELDQLKNQFIQNVSHELRTPLAIIRGYAELLNDGRIGDLLEAQREPVAIITRRSKMLVTMVEDLTTILEVEARRMTHEAIDLVELIRSTLADFKVRTNEAKLRLLAEIDPETCWIIGDSLKLRRVLDNLIGNALKFTPENGAIIVRLIQGEQSITIEVADSGIGIPADKLARVFERFYQVDGSMKRRYGGTGLGLALVKDIIIAHKGEVSAHSVVGEGTTFRVTLPLPQLADLQAITANLQEQKLE